MDTTAGPLQCPQRAGRTDAMNIPTVETCYRLICKMKMLEHIVVHSLQVCRVATFLADALRQELGEEDAGRPRFPAEP